MTKSILASAAFALLATVSSAALAEGLDPSNFRKLVVEPKGDATNNIAVQPEGASGDTVDVQPIVVEPKAPVIAVEPKQAAPRIAIQPAPRPDLTIDAAGADAAADFEEEAPQPDVFAVAPGPRIAIQPRPRPDVSAGADAAPDFEEEAAEPDFFAEEPAAKAPGADKAPEAAALPADVAGATALYSLLTSRGYAVEILKYDAYGRYVFHVSGQGAVYLLVVDGPSGEVLRKQVIQAAYDHAPAYEAPAPAYKAPVPAYKPPTQTYKAPAYSYEAPAYQAPTYTYKAPVYKAPPAYGYKAPVYNAPRYAPAYKAPSYGHTGQGYGGGSYGGGSGYSRY